MLTRKDFLRVAGASVAAIPAALGFASLTGKTGFESTAPIGHDRVQLIHDRVPEKMKYQEVHKWPHYNIHPFVELEWWLGTSRELVDDYNRLGWRFTHLPDNEVALSLWESTKAEGISTSILLTPNVEVINRADADDYSVVWEVLSVQDGCRWNPWDTVFGDHGKVVEWSGGCATTEQVSFWFKQSEDSVRDIALWMVNWLTIATQAARDFYPSTRGSVKCNTVSWKVREAPDLDSYTETFYPLSGRD